MTKISLSSLSITALVLATTALGTLSGCNNVSPNVQNIEATPIVTKSATISAVQTETLLSPAVQTVVGDYASSDYDKRAQGYDWVGVIISANGSDEIDIKVRSRADIKKPSCNFDGKATLMGQDNAHGVILLMTVRLFCSLKMASSPLMHKINTRLIISAQGVQR